MERCRSAWSCCTQNDLKAAPLKRQKLQGFIGPILNMIGSCWTIFFLLAVKACRAIRHTFCRKNWNIRLIRLRCLSGWWPQLLANVALGSGSALPRCIGPHRVLACILHARWRQLGRPGPSCAAFGNPNGGKSEKRDEKRELSSLTCFYYFGMNHILADFWYRGLRGYLEHWHLVVVWTPADWQVVCGSHRNWVARTCRGICSTGFRHIPTPVQQLHSRYICRISSRALDRGAFPGNDIDMVDQCGSWLVYNSQRGCQQCDLVKTCKR